MSVPHDAPKQLSPQETDVSQHSVAVTLAKHHRQRIWHLVHPPWYRNSLLASTGYLEFANAGDFAANVWNEIPVPRHALILMAIGGPLALMMSVVALRDGLLSWQNVQLLRTERRFLKSLKQQHLQGDANPDLLRLIDSRLGVGFRELGTELVDRIAMDVLLGVGALIVGTGTIMAIWGANPRVFHASNLLSGFVGNGFAAAFGVVNAIWSTYLVVRFYRHEVACEGVSSVVPFWPRVHLRFCRLRWHAVVSGSTGLIAGAASMITAKRWWGYVILIPCMVLQVACNWLWRVHLGHDRPVVSASPLQGLGMEDATARDEEKVTTVLLDQLAATVALYNALGSLPPDGQTDSVEIDMSTLESLVLFLLTHELFDSLCAWIARERSVPEDLRGMLVRVSPEEKEFSLCPNDFLRLPVEVHGRVQGLIREFLQDEARAVLRSRERYLIEMVGWTMMTGSLCE